MNKQNELENTIYSKLEEKIAQDKAARYLNKLLLDSKEMIQEQGLLLVETENSYGKKLLELEQLNSHISHEKTDLEELVQRNAAREKEIDEIGKEIKNHDIAIERKQVKIISLNKSIEEVMNISAENLLQHEIDKRFYPHTRCCFFFFLDIIAHWRCRS